ncbi:NB-ARC domain-containing protein [Planomonospora parontospora]|nr:NB-ARC domain-containing protein [Planomonospora parontospora]
MLLGRFGGRVFIVPTTLPVVPPVLVGRKREISELSEKVESGSVSVLIKGQPGIGKTTLALAVAHNVAPRFPDGQLFVMLNPHLPGGTGIFEALGLFVAALQRAGDSVPDTLESRRAVYAKLTQRRRVLVVIDDVPEGADIGELAPEGENCALIITSRGAVHGIDFSAEVRLKPLAEREASEFLEGVLGSERFRTEEWGFLIRECRSEPLALAIVGSALAARPNWGIDDARQRLVKFAEERARHQTEASPYDTAYVLLTEEEKNALRSLAAIGSTEFQPWKLAAAAGTDQTEGNRLAARLAGARLLERHSSDVSGLPYCRVPEPVLEYSRLLSTLEDPQTQHRRTAQLDSAVQERRERDPARQVREDVYSQLKAGEITGALDMAKDALQIAGERGVSEAEAAAYAALSEIYTELGDMTKAEEMAVLAIRCGHPGSTARALRCQGRNARRLRQYGEAASHLDGAIRSAKEAEDFYELLRIRTEYAVMEATRGRQPAARRQLDHIREGILPAGGSQVLRARIAWARAVVDMSGGRHGDAENALLRARGVDAGPLQHAWLDQALSKNALLAGDHPASARYAQTGLTAFVAMRCRYGAAHCRFLYGTASYRQGDTKEAVFWLQEAVETFSVCGDAWVEAAASLELARAYLGLNQDQEASRLLGAAKEGFRRLGDPDGVRRVEAEEDGRPPGGARGRRRRAVQADGFSPLP